MSVAADIRAEREAAQVAGISDAIERAEDHVASAIDIAFDDIVARLPFSGFTAKRTQACKKAAQTAVREIIREHAGEIPAEIEFLHLGCAPECPACTLMEEK